MDGQSSPGFDQQSAAAAECYPMVIMEEQDNNSNDRAAGPETPEFRHQNDHDSRQDRYHTRFFSPVGDERVKTEGEMAPLHANLVLGDSTIKGLHLTVKVHRKQRREQQPTDDVQRGRALLPQRGSDTSTAANDAPILG